MRLLMISFFVIPELLLILHDGILIPIGRHSTILESYFPQRDVSEKRSS
jgi:hypothetical protein